MTDWPQFRFDAARTGFTPDVSLDRTTVKAQGMVEKWRYPTSGWVTSSPAVVGGVVYVGSDDGIVRAMDVTTGALKWSYDTVTPVNSSPAVAGGLVLVGSDDGTLYALDAADGAVKWSKTLKAPLQSSPAVVGDQVYIGGSGGALRVFDLAGVRVWRYLTGTGVLTSPAVDADGTVYVGSSDWNVYAINPDGTLKWTTPTIGPVLATPCVADGLVLIGSCVPNPPPGSEKSGLMYALDTATGAVVWTAPSGSLMESSVAVAEGVAYYGAHNGNIESHDLGTGLKLSAWTTGPRPVRSSPALANGIVWHGSTSLGGGSDTHVPRPVPHIWARRSTPAADALALSKLWFGLQDDLALNAVNSSPAVVDGCVYVGSDDGNLYCFALGG